MSDPKQEKAESLTKIIQLKEDLDKTKAHVSKLDNKIVELNEKVDKNYREQRKTANSFKYYINVILEIAKGHKEEVAKNQKRETDTKEKLDRIEDILKWVSRSIAGLLVVTIFAAVLKYIWRI